MPSTKNKLTQEQIAQGLESVRRGKLRKQHQLDSVYRTIGLVDYGHKEMEIKAAKRYDAVGFAVFQTHGVTEEDSKPVLHFVGTNTSPTSAEQRSPVVRDVPMVLVSLEMLSMTPDEWESEEDVPKKTIRLRRKKKVAPAHEPTKDDAPKKRGRGKVPRWAYGAKKKPGPRNRKEKDSKGNRKGLRGCVKGTNNIPLAARRSRGRPKMYEDSTRIVRLKSLSATDQKINAKLLECRAGTARFTTRKLTANNRIKTVGSLRKAMTNKGIGLNNFAIELKAMIDMRFIKLEVEE